MRLLRYLGVCLLILTFMAWSSEIAAQCPMCRMAAESNLENGGSEGKGLNLGILYMLATPYLLIGTIGFLWWKNRRKDVSGQVDLED